MKIERFRSEVQSVHQSGERIQNWHVGRIYPTPYLVPENWKLVRLTSVAKLESGHTPSRSASIYWDGGNIPWISLHDSQALDGSAIATTAQSVTAEGIHNSSARLLPKGTVVFSRTATVGKSTIMGAEMATSQDFANFVCGKWLHNRYLMYLFRFMVPEWTRLMAGSTHNTIYMPTFEALQILLPPLREQEAIAEALGDADALIDALERLLAKKRELKQGAMQELLTGKRRLPGFGRSGERTSTEAGGIPEDWRAIPLGAIGKFKNGINKNAEAFGRGSPFVNLQNVFGVNSISSVDGLGLIACTSTERNAYDLRKGDVIFVRSSVKASGVGLTAVIEDNLEDTVFSGFLIRFRDHGEINNAFKRYCFYEDRFRNALMNISSVSANTNISQDGLKNLLIALPSSRDEQAAIALALADMDAEIAALEKKLAKTRSVKQGMMQQLLTGQIRLI